MGVPETGASIARRYLQPLFAFSRRRTTSLDEAQDLTAEILVQIYDSLGRRKEIRDVRTWVWSIAHHTYAKHLVRSKGPVSTVGVSPDWFPDLRFRDPEAELLRSEEIGEIRRRVAFLSELHHRITILRYFRGKKVGDIATILRLPEGTVKWHLFEIRNGLRMEIERMKGQPNNTMASLGCDPGRLTVGISGNYGHTIRPSELVNNRLILQNILLAAHPKPRSTQEIAKALGIPTPYVADEVRQLHDAELLAKTNDECYITDFVIRNLAMTREWYQAIEEDLDFYVSSTKSFFHAKREEISSILSVSTDDGYARALWTLIPYACNPDGILQVDDLPPRPMRNDGAVSYTHLRAHET